MNIEGKRGKMSADFASINRGQTVDIIRLCINFLTVIML